MKASVTTSLQISATISDSEGNPRGTAIITVHEAQSNEDVMGVLEALELALAERSQEMN